MVKKQETILFALRAGESYIPLIQLLKATGIVDSGSEAQEAVAAGIVLRNGEVELRKRAKITAGETVTFQGFRIVVQKAEE